MKIIDLTLEHENLYFCCLEEWSEEMKEAGDHKKHWYEKMKEKGVRVKLAQKEKGDIIGMIQYLPIEFSMFEGQDSYVVLCIWVHGYKQGVGNNQKKGVGKALLKAAEEDCLKLGAKGLVAWGLLIPVFMRASWFKSQGYKVIDKDGMIRLLWKPFNNFAEPPKFIKPKRKPEKGKDKVDISIFRNGWCPAMNIGYERTLRALKEFGDKVSIKEFDTTNNVIFNEWGISDGLFIDGKEVRLGPPPTYEKIRKKIERRAKKIKG